MYNLILKVKHCQQETPNFYFLIDFIVQPSFIRDLTVFKIIGYSLLRVEFFNCFGIFFFKNKNSVSFIFGGHNFCGVTFVTA